jgi:hypothetical protein
MLVDFELISVLRQLSGLGLQTADRGRTLQQMATAASPPGLSLKVIGDRLACNQLAMPNWRRRIFLLLVNPHRVPRLKLCLWKQTLPPAEQGTEAVDV